MRDGINTIALGVGIITFIMVVVFEKASTSGWYKQNLFIFIYLFKAESQSITEKKHTQKKQNKIKQQKLHRMIQIQKFKNLFQTFKKI